MATSMAETFDVWLTSKLKSVSPDIDTDVFVTYIIGILESDDTDTEKDESISELLEGVVECEIARETCKAIMDEWSADVESKKNTMPEEDMGDKLSEMFGKQTLATVKEKKLNQEEEARKAAILAQYGHVSEDEDDDDELLPGADGEEAFAGKNSSKADTASDSLLVRNTNKEEVSRLEKATREKSRQESEKKKDKDKQDRQAQKQKQEERKETEKKRTQRGERRR